jgi:hypothetical protein
MGIHNFASRRTSKDLVTGDLTLTVASGQPIQVCGIVFDNNTGSAIRVQLNDANGTKISSVNVPACETFEMGTHWLADAGLQLVSECTGMYVTVFHNNPGN